MTNIAMQDNTATATATAAALVPVNADLTRTIFRKKGMNFFPATAGDAPPEIDRLPAGNYVIQFNPMMGYYLEMIESFPIITKVYGSAAADADRILNTFRARSKNLGVLLNGLKGSGKTLTSRLVCQKAQELGMPTLLINTAYTGDAFYQFLYQIKQECVIMLDEFEKTYDEEQQASMLTVLDGTYPSKKLFLLTSNVQGKIDPHLITRPGRIHYHFEFNGLDAKFIKEFAEDTLQDKSQIKDLLRVCSAFQPMNFDSLSAIIWEMNQYKETAGNAIRFLNTRPEAASRYYNFLVTLPGATAPIESEVLTSTLAYDIVNPSVIKLQIGLPMRLKHIETLFHVPVETLIALAGNAGFFESCKTAEEAAKESVDDDIKREFKKGPKPAASVIESRLESAVQNYHGYGKDTNVFKDGAQISMVSGRHGFHQWQKSLEFQPTDMIAMEFTSGVMTFQNKAGVRLDLIPQTQERRFSFQDWASQI